MRALPLKARFARLWRRINRCDPAGHNLIAHNMLCAIAVEMAIFSR